MRSDASKSLAYGWDDQGIVIRFPAREIFSLLLSFQRGCGASSTSYPKGVGGSLLGIKRPRSETDHSPPFNVQVSRPVKPRPAYFFTTFTRKTD